MTKRLLIVTQKVDCEDDLLGFFVGWIAEFAKHFDEVDVITLSRGNYRLPSHVHVYSLGKENNNFRITRLFNFYKYLFQLVPKSTGIFAHMSPVFVIASWPVAFIYGKKIIFWYLHRSVTVRLRLAEKMCYKIVTAAKESLKISSNKIIETGHGINVEKYREERRWDSPVLRILSVGRISPIKNYETLIKSAKILKDSGVSFRIKIVGRPIMKSDQKYLKSLTYLRDDLGLIDLVEFVGFISHDKMPDYYRNTDIVIGLTPNGGIDKTILEGMASGCLVLTSNNANRKYFGSYTNKLIFAHSDSADLAEKIGALNYALAEKNDISQFLVKSVSIHHNLKILTDRLTELFFGNND